MFSLPLNILIFFFSKFSFHLVNSCLLNGRVCVLKEILVKQMLHGEILLTVNILPVFSDQMSLVEPLMGNLPLNTALTC